MPLNPVNSTILSAGGLNSRQTMPAPDRASGTNTSANQAHSKAPDRQETIKFNKPGSKKAPSGRELTPSELQQIEELKRTDMEVRRHEQAHIAAGGRYVRGGASFQYKKGPDGKSYAVAGEVSIDTSEERDPAATIRKMETVRKAALAPARPSAKDRAVAAKAAAKEAEARAELARQRAEEPQGSDWEGRREEAPGASGRQGPGTLLDIVV